MHRIHPSPERPQQQKFEPKYFSTSIPIDPTSVQRFSPTFIVLSFVLRQPFDRARISHSLAYLFIGPRSRTERNHPRKRKVKRRENEMEK